MRGTSREGRLAFALATAAVAWGLLLIAAALLAPAYSGLSCTATTNGPSSCTHQTQTFVDVNGSRGLLLILLPAAVTAIGWLLLHARCARRIEEGSVAASLCAVPLLAFSVIAGLSIGPFVLPMPLLLLAAARRTPYGTQSAPR